jgi:probable phosphoglycerate mutase
VSSFESQEASLIYLLRHGATRSNLENPPRLQGQGVDLDLSDEGREQTAITAAFFAQLEVDAVYASPLRRSQATAAEIAAPHRLCVEIAPALIESDVGRWEGKNWREIEESDPQAHRLYREDAARYGYPEGENLTQINARVLKAATEIAERCLGGSAVIVGHGMANRALIAPLLGLPLAQAWRLPQDNCAINVLRFSSGRWKVETMNSTLHLFDAKR